MDVAQLVIAATVPIAVLLVGWLANRSLTRFETRQASNQNLVEKRIQVYGSMAADLNSIYCFFQRVGHYKKIDPNKMLRIKRRIDRVAHTQRPFFDPAHHLHYLAFMDTCFDTHTGVAQNAKIRADPAKYEEEFASAWDSDWNSQFVVDLATDRRALPADDPDKVTQAVVHDRYEELVDSFSAQMGIPTPVD
jgi:hypothetical protein